MTSKKRTTSNVKDEDLDDVLERFGGDVEKKRSSTDYASCSCGYQTMVKLDQMLIVLLTSELRNQGTTLLTSELRNYGTKILEGDVY